MFRVIYWSVPHRTRNGIVDLDIEDSVGTMIPNVGDSS
jgi:hypothetical protein